MPLLWGLLSLPTVSEVGALAVLGKVCGGDVGGIPAPYYAADWLVSGLAFLRLPTDRELQQAAIKDVKKARQSALSQDFVGHGYLFSFPFHTGLAVLTNAIVAALLLCGLRLVWTWGVRGRDEPGELSLHASPADAAALVLFVAAIVLLLGLHNTCYSTQESAGLSAVYASMAASIGVLGVVISEEIPSLNFELHSTAVILNEHWKQKLTSGAPVPIIAALWRIATPSPFVLTFITAVTCVAATYGLSSATWRLVRCHYQLSDRAGNALAEVEKKRQQDLLNYKLARLNKNMQNNPFLNQAPEAGGPQADGSAAEQPPLDGSLAGCAGYYRTFGLKLLSWLTIAAPVAVAASFVHAASGASPEVVCWRQLCCAALVASRLALAKTYLQTFLLRDSNEALKRSDSKNFARTLSGVHSRAVLLLPRTAIVLLAPAAAMMALLLLDLRLTPANELPSPLLTFGSLVASVVPSSLAAHEFGPIQDATPVAAVRQVVAVLTFWIAASEAAFITLYCGYRWALRLFANLSSTVSHD